MLIVTDLPPEVADAYWYSMRSWIECMFKDGKRGGLAWHQTKMIHPKRAQRHWLAYAIAILWQVSVGGEPVRWAGNADLKQLANPKGAVDANLPISSVDELPPNHIARRNLKYREKNRWLSCFRRGYLVIKAAFLNHLTLPLGGFFPQPWPTFTPELSVPKITFSSA
ncbi:hypothetical protein [Nostoc sp. CHAB 5715]|uniref:hypothetical protein n=1 Tax=Nostoc sp. CHAB 5715 TaxID=2780400 RepID=UPI001E3CEDBB|nr:hypothetical protein [Nostoc sp. CHAB 5715]MCC5624165.1 hypothetical protein [Nostoc sp. CHAB 5715]